MSLPIVSQILDPIYHSNTRTEFKLFGRDRVYMPKMRLSSFGVSAVVNPLPAPQRAQFNLEGGVYSLIKQASLYFNDILVDQVKDASRVLPIQKNVMSSYEASNDSYFRRCTGIAPVWKAENNIVLDRLPLSYKLVGLLSLAEVFPVLKQAPALPNIYEIRVVIEYETNKGAIFANPLPQSFTVSEPKIIVDEMMDTAEVSEFLNKDMSLSIPCVLTERVIVSASTNPQSIRLMAFDGMTLIRLVANAQINNLSDIALCNSKSDVVQGETINFMVNSRKLLPYRGLDHPQKKLYIAGRSMGDHISPFGGADGNLVGDVADTFEDVYSTSLINTIGNKLSYTAVDVNNRISNLYFEISKTQENTIYYYFYGLVFKYLAKKGDVVETGYM
jgi:hypothetical protein